MADWRNNPVEYVPGKTVGNTSVGPIPKMGSDYLTGPEWSGSYSDPTSKAYRTSRSYANELFQLNRPDENAWKMAEGVSQMGQSGINSVLANNPSTQYADSIGGQQRANLYRQGVSLGMLNNMANNGQGVASLQSQIARDNALKQLSSSSSPISSRNAILQLGANADKIGSGAMSGNSQERMGLRSALQQGSSSYNNQALQMLSAQMERENQDAMYRLAQEKAAAGWAGLGLQEKMAISKQLQDYEKYRQGVAANEVAMATAEYSKRLPNVSGFNYGNMIEGLGNLTYQAANAYNR